MSASRVTSQRTGRAVRPFARSWSASASTLETVRLAITTRAPASARAHAAPIPTPCPAPVTIATLPSRLLIDLDSRWRGRRGPNLLPIPAAPHGRWETLPSCRPSGNGRTRDPGGGRMIVCCSNGSLRRLRRSGGGDATAAGLVRMSRKRDRQAELRPSEKELREADRVSRLPTDVQARHSSAVPADSSKLEQVNSYGELPDGYVDRPFVCRGCGSQEIWRAHDQKWYYEEAKGHIDAFAVECRACRTSKRSRSER